MTYPRIETVSDLPPEGPFNDRAREKSDLDFKTFADPAKSWEHAKDIAAFANALGGVLLVGADDKTGNLVYPGIAGQTVNEIKAIYEGAAQLCSPSPIVDVVPIPEKNLVAVNVEPFVDQLVAAPAGTKDKNGVERKHDIAWVFPIRQASQTEFIKPENLGMYMNREVRRAVLLLAKIPPAARRQVLVYYGGPGMDHPTTKGLCLTEVLPDRNVAAFELATGQGSLPMRVPLRDVVDVWEYKHDAWAVRLAGDIQQGHDNNATVRALYYVPPLQILRG